MEGKEEEEEKSYFEDKGMKVRFNRGQRYLVEICGRWEEMEQWIRPKLLEWAETIEALGRFAFRYRQIAYTGLVMSLQVEWQYLIRTVPGVG